MSSRPKILLLDDEQDLLELYKELLLQLPSKPEIHLANSGARALALLESEPFNLLISDLRMPKMDGLQVLSIVRRKFPDLRVVVMTSVSDEQYRSRAYAMGVDLFWEKPNTSAEIKLFQDCIASLISQKTVNGGFRGIQSKSLVDIIQLECLSQSSSVLKITNGPREGRIWIMNGNVIDAAAGEKSGHEAFKEIFRWKGGGFEILPAEPNRARKITEGYQGLLLATAQSIDESQSQTASSNTVLLSKLSSIGRTEGIEFIMEMSMEEHAKPQAWGVEHPEPVAEWASQTRKSLAALGEKLRAGDLTEFYAMGLQRHATIIVDHNKVLCAAMNRSLTQGEVRETIQKVKTKWAS